MATKKAAPVKAAPGKAAPGKAAGRQDAEEAPGVPGTLQRSPAKVQRTYEKALDSAAAEYDDEARAHRTAWGAVKNVAEKRGDHWELKDEAGPSDPRSQQPAAQKRAGVGETFGGVDVLGNTRDQLVDRARKAGIRGYSRMTKAELGRQLARHEELPARPQHVRRQVVQSESTAPETSPAAPTIRRSRPNGQYDGTAGGQRQ